MAHRVTRNSNSNYVPIEGCNNGSLTFCSRNWLWNIFPISRDQSSENQILGKNTFVASYSRAFIALEMCWNVNFGHRFDINFWTVRNLKNGLKVLESRHSELEFEHKFWIFLIKIKRVISFEYSPPSYSKFRFLLCADWGA